MTFVWNEYNVDGVEGPVTSERIIRDIDRVRSSIITIIEHSGIVVHELDVRHGYRKDNLSENKVQYLSPEAQKGLEEQLAAGRSSVEIPIYGSRMSMQTSSLCFVINPSNSVRCVLVLEDFFTQF